MDFLLVLASILPLFCGVLGFRLRYNFRQDCGSCVVFF